MNVHLKSLSDNIVIDPEKCIFCGTCVEACTVDNLRLQLAPCRVACPLHLNCQGYVQLLARGKPEQALAVIREVVPFAGILGRICSHPCEQECERQKVDGQPVAIRALKRFLDTYEDELQLDFSVPVQHQKRVAIVGSGPAGMMAGWDLRKMGYQVVIFEASARPGGLLASAIPEFRLPGHVVEREFGYLTQLGVEVRCNSAVGGDVSFEELMDTFDAIFLAVGAPRSGSLNLSGELARGVYSGMEFLQAARREPASLEVGRRVVVVGGGNVAVDAAQTALRLGGESVHLVCLESREEIPAFTWAVEDALAEGVKIVSGRGPERLITQDGHISAIELKACTRVFDAEGRFAPLFDATERRTMAIDTLIVAIGQQPDAEFLSGLGIDIQRGRVCVDPLTKQTSNPKVFAGGDVVVGAGSVVHAMADGKAAAESIARFLRGDSLSYGRDFARGPYITDFEADRSLATPHARVYVPRRDGAGPHNFLELEADLSLDQAQREASRCLSCGMPEGAFRSCWYCLPCEVACPEDALRVDLPYLLR